MYHIHHGITHATPEESQFDPDAIETLNKHLLKLIDKDKIQCASYIMARKGKIFANSSFGPISGLKKAGDLKPDSIRMIASITKVITSIAVMQLIENGFIDLHQPVSEFIEELDNPMHKGITVYHCLTHTTGIAAMGGYFMEPYPRDLFDELYNNKDWIKAGLQGVPFAKPGEVWAYLGVGFSFLGEIVRRVTGLSFEEYCINNIFEPLKMDRTFFQVPEAFHKDVCIVKEDELEDLEPIEDEALFCQISSGGGLSTTYDLWKLGQMLCNGGTFDGKRILGRKTVEAMTRNQLVDVTASEWGGPVVKKQYGLGVNIETRSIVSIGTFGHEGAGRSFLLVDPSEEFVAICFVPSEHEWVPESQLNVMSIMWSGLN